jgi:hypothetical protein
MMLSILLAVKRWRSTILQHLMVILKRVDFLTVWTPEEKTDDEPSET